MPRVRDFANRNIQTLENLPGPRGIPRAPATQAEADDPDYQMAQAMRLRKANAAERVQELSIKQMESAAELEALKLEEERETTLAQIAELRAARAATSGAGGNDMIGFMQFQMAQASEREVALRTQMSELADKQFVMQQTQMQQMQDRMELLANGGGPKTFGIDDAAQMVLGQKKALQALGLIGEDASTKSTGMSFDEYIRQQELQHKLRMDAFEFELKKKQIESEIEGGQALVNQKGMAMMQMGQTLEKIGPPLVDSLTEALSARVRGGPAPEIAAPELTIVSSDISTKCGGCGHSFDVPQGVSEAECPECHSMLDIEGATQVVVHAGEPEPVLTT